MPLSLSPSFLMTRVDVRFAPPISYSHFHVPTGSAAFLSSRAVARPHSPNISAAERIVFMVAPAKGWAEAVRRGPAADGDCRDDVPAGQDCASMQPLPGVTVERTGTS